MSSTNKSGCYHLTVADLWELRPHLNYVVDLANILHNTRARMLLCHLLLMI